MAMNIAVYGTLKKGFWNHPLMDGLEFIKKSFVKCYWITWGWFPTAQFKQLKNTDERILLEVEVYEIPNSSQGNNKLQQIDSLEWHPSRYERIQIKDEDEDIIEIYHQSTNSVIDKEQLVHIEDNKYARKALSINEVPWT